MDRLRGPELLPSIRGRVEGGVEFQRGLSGCWWDGGYDKNG